MTVFGFGRGSSASSHLTGAGRKFTIGLLPTTQYGAARAQIEGAYKDVTLQVAAAEHLVPGCGNGQLDAGEQCDDGNVQAGDGCDATCRIEYECGDGIVRTRASSATTATPRTATAAASTACSRSAATGSVEAGEQCDDGNTTTATAATTSCTLSGCGNGVVDGGERASCDDGNAAERRRLRRELHARRAAATASWTAGEQCDDGNASNGDGCPPPASSPTCGDGFVRSRRRAVRRRQRLEQRRLPRGLHRRASAATASCAPESRPCDDGNVVDGDTCTNFCRANLIRNGTYASGTSQWFFFSDASAAFSVVSGEARVAITTQGSNVQLYEAALALSGSTGYVARFRGRSTGGPPPVLAARTSSSCCSSTGRRSRATA